MSGTNLYPDQQPGDKPSNPVVVTYTQEVEGKPYKVSLCESTAPGQRYCDIFQEEIEPDEETGNEDSTKTDSKSNNKGQ